MPRHCKAEEKDLRTIATGLRKPTDASDVAAIEDAVQRAHKVVLFAHEAIAIMVREDAEAKRTPMPLSHKGFVSALFHSLVNGHSTKYTHIRSRVRKVFHSIHGQQPLVSADGLEQLLTFETTKWIASFKTNVKTHFKDRVARYAKEILIPPVAGASSTPLR